jgi:hypothetical protein
MFEYLDVENHLTSLNRMYSYDFRDTKCISEGNCRMPSMNPGFWSSSEGILITLVYWPLSAVAVVAVPLVLIASVANCVGIFRGGEYSELLVVNMDAVDDKGSLSDCESPPDDEIRIFVED